MRVRYFVGGWVKQLGILVVLFLGLLLGIPSGSTWGEPLRQAAGDGKALYESRCAACHTIGGGDRAGPDLKAVTTRRDGDWLKRWISAPDKMLAQGDPIAAELLRAYNNLPMPNSGLTNDQTSAVIAYLTSTAGGVTTAPSAQPAPAQGDPVLGKDLFGGVTGFRNGAPPCIACHTIAGIGALGGGALGPDLTGAYSKYGDGGLVSVLNTLPFPTMNPVFSGRPLTPEEQAHLKSFLQAASAAQRPVEAVGQLGVLAIVGAAVLILLAHVFWRRRLSQVRRPLVAR